MVVCDGGHELVDTFRQLLKMAYLQSVKQIHEEAY